MRAALERLAGGTGGIVSILGDAGVGKSRLIAEVRRGRADRNVLWLEGETLSSGQTASYWLGDSRHVARAEALFSEMGVRATGNLALNFN